MKLSVNGENILIKRKSNLLKSGLIAEFSGVKFSCLLYKCVATES